MEIRERGSEKEEDKNERGCLYVENEREREGEKERKKKEDRLST